MDKRRPKLAQGRSKLQRLEKKKLCFSKNKIQKGSGGISAQLRKGEISARKREKVVWGILAALWKEGPSIWGINLGIPLPNGRKLEDKKTARGRRKTHHLRSTSVG